MNHVFRVVWNAAASCWVAVAEIAPARGKASKSSKNAVAGAMLLALAGAGAHAQTTIVDGNGGGGCMVGVAGCALPTSNAVYTHFHTQGGAGSGGGAGLGGVFFVDSGSALQLNNVSFEHNVVQGGDGGSTPDVVISSAMMPLAEKTADVASVTAFQITPTIVETIDGKLLVTGVSMSTGNPLLKTGSVVAVGGTGGATTISEMTGNSVTFDQAVEIDAASAVKTVGGSSVASGSAVVTSTNFSALQPSDIATGMTVIGEGIPAGTTVTQVTRDTATNAVLSVTLSNNATANVSGADLRFVNVTSFDASQFAKTPDLGPNQIRIPAMGVGLAVGMTLNGDGVPPGTQVTAIDGDVVTLSQPISGLSFSGTLPVGAVGRTPFSWPPRTAASPSAPRSAATASRRAPPSRRWMRKPASSRSARTSRPCRPSCPPRVFWGNRAPR